jgi:hypothetical protein
MCSARAQLLCLPFYLPDDEELAERVSYTWAGLSRACHQHPYELPPTSSELLAWIATVEQLISRVQSIISVTLRPLDLDKVRDREDRSARSVDGIGRLIDSLTSTPPSGEP